MDTTIEAEGLEKTYPGDVRALDGLSFAVEAGSIVHRYPICWRCATPLVFRIADDWMIRADEIRQPMLDANATVE